MAKKKSSTNIVRAKSQLPEYAELVGVMQSEAASILTDYIRQWIQVGQKDGIFLNTDRVGRTQTYQELAWYDMYAEVQRDPHISALLTSAKINVAGMKYTVEAYEERGEKKPSARNQAVADFVQDVLDKTGHFPQHLYNLMDALGMGFSVSEIIWDVRDDGIYIRDIKNRPQRRFQFDVNTYEPKLRSTTSPYYGEILPEKKFIVHRNSSQWSNPFGDALLQNIFWTWLFKKTVTKFWMQHLQVGASSVPIVKHPAGANAELKAEALSIAQQIRNGAYGRIPSSFEIIWAESTQGAQNAEAYEKFVRMCNEEMSKCINGQTLTMEASGQGGAGSRALGSVHEGTQSDRDIYRAAALSATINFSLVKWIVDFNFADVEGYPKFRFDLEEPDDLVIDAQIVKTLSDAGFSFDEVELSEKFNYTISRKEQKPILDKSQQDVITEGVTE